MAQKLETDFLIESWRHQGHELFSNCSFPYHVYNIKLIETPWNSSFSSYYDHSKWCVSRSAKDQWTCIGDLNHAAQQAKRSGGFICTQNQYIYKAFRWLVLSYYDCHEFALGAYSTEGWIVSHSRPSVFIFFRRCFLSSMFQLWTPKK